MKTTAKLNNLRIAPRKVRLVADVIRGKKAGQARDILTFSIKGASGPILKLLNSAIANARNNFQLDENNLFVKKITIDEGRKLKRWMPRARGSASEITKRSSRITLVLEEINPTKESKKPKSSKRKVQKEALEEIKDANENKEEKKYTFKKPKIEREAYKPKTPAGLNRIFRRKSV
jgi:large subunit ribosomal protein L22